MNQEYILVNIANAADNQPDLLLQLSKAEVENEVKLLLIQYFNDTGVVPVTGEFLVADLYHQRRVSIYIKDRAHRYIANERVCVYYVELG